MKKITLNEKQVRDIMRLSYAEGFGVGIIDAGNGRIPLDTPKSLKELGESSFEGSIAVHMLSKMPFD